MTSCYKNTKTTQEKEIPKSNNNPPTQPTKLSNPLNAQQPIQCKFQKTQGVGIVQRIENPEIPPLTNEEDYGIGRTALAEMIRERTEQEETVNELLPEPLQEELRKLEYDYRNAQYEQQNAQVALNNATASKQRLNIILVEQQTKLETLEKSITGLKKGLHSDNDLRAHFHILEITEGEEEKVLLKSSINRTVTAIKENDIKINSAQDKLRKAETAEKNARANLTQGNRKKNERANPWITMANRGHTRHRRRGN